MKPLKVCIVEPANNPITIIETLETGLVNADIIVSKIAFSSEIYKQLNHVGAELILLIGLLTNDLLSIISQIRQQKDYLNIPLIVMSPPQEIMVQLNALSLEIDGFISLPIQNESFISMIKTRIMRARSLGTQMIRDSLTGLLNHARIIEQLEVEIARAQRDNTPLSFAMIDIDHFKTINDLHGHIAGDNVIKNLANLFEQRLRKSDSIGRYGGDEFAIILPESTALTVYPMLMHIKNSFSHFQHNAHGTNFTTTFSVGIANLSPSITDAPALIQAADDALYQAKNQNRDQIVIAN